LSMSNKSTCCFYKIHISGIVTFTWSLQLNDCFQWLSIYKTAHNHLDCCCLGTKRRNPIGTHYLNQRCFHISKKLRWTNVELTSVPSGFYLCLCTDRLAIEESINHGLITSADRWSKSQTTIQIIAVNTFLQACEITILQWLGTKQFLKGKKKK
jgi:hypothetical protein